MPHFGQFWWEPDKDDSNAKYSAPQVTLATFTVNYECEKNFYTHTKGLLIFIIILLSER